MRNSFLAEHPQLGLRRGTVVRNYNKNLIKLDKMGKWDIWKLVLPLETDQRWLYSPQLAFRTETLHSFFIQRFKLLYSPLYWRKHSSCPRALQFSDSQRSSVSSEGMVSTKQQSFQQASKGFKRQQQQQRRFCLIEDYVWHKSHTEESMEMSAKQMGWWNTGIVGWGWGIQKDLLPSTGQRVMGKHSMVWGWKTEGLALLDKYNLVVTLEEETQPNDMVVLVTGKSKRKITGQTLCVEDRTAQNISYFFCLITLVPLVPGVHSTRTLHSRHAVRHSTAISQSASIYRLSWPGKPNSHLVKKSELFQAESPSCSSTK